jgi:hypothetical protein
MFVRFVVHITFFYYQDREPKNLLFYAVEEENQEFLYETQMHMNLSTPMSLA